MKIPFPGKDRGFSLVELMVTILILGLLMGSVLPAIDSMVRRGKTAAMRSNGHTVQSIAEGYKLDYNGEVPTSRAQMCASPTYTDITNPYNKALKGLNSSFPATNGCAAHEMADFQAPVLIAPEFLTSWGNNSLFNGTVWYIPYNSLHGDCSTKYGAADNCLGMYANGLFGSWGGSTSLSGYEYYVIMAIGTDDRNPNLYIQVTNLQLQNF